MTKLMQTERTHLTKTCHQTKSESLTLRTDLKNVIYKMLEKYHYLKFFKKLNEIMEDGKITPDELKSLSKIKETRNRSIAFTFKFDLTHLQ